MFSKSKKFFKNNKTAIVLFFVALISGYIIGTRNYEIKQAISGTEDAGLNMAEVQDLYNTLKEKYDGDINSEDVNDGVKKGLVAGLGDEYTTFFNAEEAKEFQNDLSGEIGGGIGAEIGLRNNVPTVVRALDNSPARDAGIQAGDVILSVNDEDVSNKTVEYVVGKVRGEVGTSVKIVVFRNNESKTFEVIRKNITAPNVESSLEGEIGILKLSRFDETSGEKLRQEAKKLLDQGAKKIILDIRGNGGGLVTSAQKVAGLWIDSSKTVLVEKRGDKEVSREYATGDDPILENIPTVILTNESSASASEIIAGALSEYGKATLVGTKTYGKGSVQQLIDFPNGSALKVTVAKWYTPNGVNISKQGIEPKYKVDLTADDINKGADPQKDKAIEVLNNLK